MAQTPIGDQDARSMAQKLSQFVDSLNPGERAAFEAVERQMSMLMTTDELEDEAAEETGGNKRQALWLRMATSLNPPPSGEVA